MRNRMEEALSPNTHVPIAHLADLDGNEGSAQKIGNTLADGLCCVTHAPVCRSE